MPAGTAPPVVRAVTTRSDDRPPRGARDDGRVRTATSILDDVVQYVERTGFVAHGLHVRVGVDTAEHRWTPDVREEIHSVAKGVAVLATGIAADAGLVDVDEPVGRSMPGVRFGGGTDRVTLRHLLTMTSGVDMPWSASELTDWPDLAHEFLGRPSRGRVFQYANASTYTAMRVLETRVGDVGEFVARRLLGPLGIADVAWSRCPGGHVAGGEGLSLRTAELARLGQLVRDGGEFEGRRVVGSRWCDAMHGDWVERDGAGPGYERYAMAGWDGPGGLWRLHGAHGQMLLFAGDTVVTVTADDHAGADALAASVVTSVARSVATSSVPEAPQA